MKAKMCKVLSLTLAMVLAFTLIPARELAASTNEDTSTDTVQTEEEAPADTAKDDKAENPSDDKKEDPADKAPAEINDDPEEKKQDEEKDVQQGDKQLEENPDEVAETTSATPDDDKKAPEPKNANQNRGTGDDDELAFVTQPKGGIVAPDSSIRISWETNFKPVRVEVGFWNGNQFRVVKEIKEVKGGIYYYLPNYNSTELPYNDVIDSNMWMVRAYANAKDDSPYSDSNYFSIKKEDRAFVTQPEGGIVAPDSSISISWKTNFKPARIEVGFWSGNQFKVVKEVYKLQYDYYVLLNEFNSTEIKYNDAVESNMWMVRAYANAMDDSPYADSNYFSIKKEALSFVMQPEGGIVAPDSSIRISWGTNFKPVRVEVGFWAGTQFKVVDEIYKLQYNYYVYLTNYNSTEIKYNNVIDSNMWMVRAYANANDDSPYADSNYFSINKEARTFVKQPEGGTVAPDSSIRISWGTNFKPVRVEVGFWNGNQFRVVKEIKEVKGGIYYYLENYNSTELTYNDVIDSNRWMVRAYANSKDDSPYADSDFFSINKEERTFVRQPEGGIVAPDSSIRISWETNFKPVRIEVGFWSGNQFSVVKEIKNVKGGIYYYLPNYNSTELPYNDTIDSNMWMIRAYVNPNDDSPYASSFRFTIVKATNSGSCGDNLTWSYDSGVLQITGTGAMYNYTDTKLGVAPWHWLSSKITTVVIDSRVTSIGDYAFADLNNFDSFLITGNVTTIGSHAFQGCTSLKSIRIPNNVQAMGDHAFYRAGLKSVTIGTSLKIIPYGAFAENNLESVTILDGVTTIRSQAFASNPALWKVSFPASLKTIGDGAFTDCRLNDIELPDGLTTIGKHAFSNNKTVWNIEFPASVTSIGDYAFSDCTSLTKIGFVGSAPTIGSSAFSNDTLKAYYITGLSGWDSAIKNQYGGSIEWIGLQRCSADGKLTWSLKNGVLTISGSGQMLDYSNGNRPGWYSQKNEITEIDIMPGVTHIGSNAFDDCTNVNTIIFYGSKPSFGLTPFTGITANAYYTPDDTWTSHPNYSGITWIPSDGQCGDNLFWRIDENKILHITGTGDMYDYPGNFSLPWYKWADDIVGVEIASGCTSIGEGAFYSCSKIESVTMSSTVKTIGKNAFYRCSRLSSINLSSALTTIGESAFYYCYALSEITIPDKVTVIDETAFMGCSSLKSVVIPDSVVTLGLRAFAQCSSLEYVEIGKGVTVIPGSAFSSCKNLTAVEFTGDVTAIYNYAFMGCSSLDYIELPASLKELGMSAFSGCTSLSRIKIHDKLESLDYGVFSGCSALSEAFFYGTPEQWDSVTKGSSNTALTNIIRCVRAEGDCSKNDSAEYSDVMWRLFWDGELRIFGFGKMNSYESPIFASDSSQIAPWNEFKDDITSVVIEEGVTNVGSFAFYNFTNLKSAILPEGINSIENFAFAFCGFTTLKLPDTITEIQGHAFVNCSNLESIVIPDGVQEISDDTFFRCKALTAVTIPDSVTKIGKEAFRECVALTEITIPSNVTIINNYAFDGCTGLEKVELNEGLKTINDSAFSNCSSLKEIVIPSTVTYIGNKGFSKCTSLKTVIFTGNAPLISTNRAFENVSTYAYYPANDSTWTESVRQDYGGTIKWVAYGEDDIIVKFSHSCSFSNNLSVNFYIPADEVSDYENFRLVVKKQVFNGSSYTWKETTLTDYTTSVQSGVTYLRFEYTGVAAKEMGDELEATLYMDRYGMTFNTTVDSYSVKEYAYNRLKYSDDDIFKTLLVDMLNYGAASQTYFKYNTGHLVTAELTSAQRALASEMPELKSVEDYMPIFTADEPSAYFYGKSVVMGNNVELKYYMRFDSGAPADSVVLHVEYKTVSGTLVSKNFHASEFVYDAKYDAYTVKISDISAKDMCRSIDAALYDGEYSNDNDDNRISEIMTYSIESYVYNRLQKSTDEDFKALVRALIKYGKSAENYFKTH